MQTTNAPTTTAPRALVAALLACALCASTVPAPALAERTDTGAAATGAAARDADRVVADELIVTYRSGQDIEAIADQTDVDVATTDVLARDAGKADVALVKIDPSLDDATAIARLVEDPRVESVSRNRTLRMFAAATNDKYLSQCYYLKNERIATAWKTAKAKGKVAVAVLDTGVTMAEDYRNYDLANTVDYKQAWDATTGKKLADDYIDYTGHGTAVASVIAAEANNGYGTAGVSYNAKVLPINIGDDGVTDDAAIIRGYQHVLDVAAKTKVKVINMSFGGDAARSLRPLQKLIDKAWKRGILSVSSAGNYEDDAYTSAYIKSYPASLDHVVSVGSVNSKRKRSKFSYYNDSVDLVAAGERILVPYEWTSDEPDPWHVVYHYHEGGYGYADGTSFSCPVVSGVAALLYAKKPSLSAEQAERILEDTARDLGKKGRDNSYGYGEVDATAALLSLCKPKLKVARGARKRQAKVTWSAVAGATRYRIYYRKAGEKSWKHVTCAASKTKRVLKKLKRGKRYYVRVRAYTSVKNKKTWTRYSATRSVRVK